MPTYKDLTRSEKDKIRKHFKDDPSFPKRITTNTAIDAGYTNDRHYWHELKQHMLMDLGIVNADLKPLRAKLKKITLDAYLKSKSQLKTIEYVKKTFINKNTTEERLKKAIEIVTNVLKTKKKGNKLFSIKDFEDAMSAMSGAPETQQVSNDEDKYTYQANIKLTVVDKKSKDKKQYNYEMKIKDDLFAQLGEGHHELIEQIAGEMNAENEKLKQFIAIIKKMKATHIDVDYQVLEMIEYAEFWVVDVKRVPKDEYLQELTNQVDQVGRIILEDSRQKYISNKYHEVTIDIEAKTIEDLINDTQKFEQCEAFNKDLKRSCMAHTLLHTYKKSFDRYYIKQSKKHPKYGNIDLSYKFIYELCFNAPYEGQEIPLTIDNLRPFFDEFRLGFEMFNVKNQLIHEVKHAKYNSNIKPSILRVIYHDNHAYTVDQLRSFIETVYVSHSDESLSDLMAYPKRDDNNYYVAKSEQDIVQIVRDHLKKYPKCIPIPILYNHEYEDDKKRGYELSDLLKSLMAKGLNPQVITDSGINITKIVFRNVQGFTKSIQKPISGILIEHYLYGDALTYFKRYKDLSYEFQSLLMNHHTMTWYNPEMKRMLYDYSVSILGGTIGDHDDEIQPYGDMFDFKNCYPSALLKCPYLPSIAYFETPKPYDGHAIRDDRLYTVRIHRYNMKGTVLYDVFQDEYTNMFGFNLKKLSNDQ